MAESLNGTYKSELVKPHGPWRTRGQLEIAVIEWIDWYNNTRLHREIGDIPPNTKPNGTVKTSVPSSPLPLNPHCTRPGVAHFRYSGGHPGAWRGGCHRQLT